MGNSNDTNKENKALKDIIENELQPKINHLIKQNEAKTIKEQELLDKNKDLENKIKQKRLNKNDLSDEEIQRIMLENSNLRDEIMRYKIKLNQYEKDYEIIVKENNQLKLTCGQYQLMIQTQMNNLNQNNFII